MKYKIVNPVCESFFIGHVVSYDKVEWNNQEKAEKT